VTGNGIAASAYGNSATNSMTFSGPGDPAVAIANVQVNRGNVYAMATGSTSGIDAGHIGAANLAISGNQLSATAVGNQVSSAITALR